MPHRLPGVGFQKQRLAHWRPSRKLSSQPTRGPAASRSETTSGFARRSADGRSPCSQRPWGIRLLDRPSSRTPDRGLSNGQRKSLRSAACTRPGSLVDSMETETRFSKSQRRGYRSRLTHRIRPARRRCTHETIGLRTRTERPRACKLLDRIRTARIRQRAVDGSLVVCDVPIRDLLRPRCTNLPFQRLQRLGIERNPNDDCRWQPTSRTIARPSRRLFC